MVKDGLRDALSSLDTEKQHLIAEREQLVAEKKSYFYVLSGVVSLIGVGIFALAYFFVEPKINEYLTYSKSHEALEKGSVYGA